MWELLSKTFGWLFFRGSETRADFDSISRQWEGLSKMLNERLERTQERLDEVEIRLEGKIQRLTEEHEQCVQDRNQDRHRIAELELQLRDI